MVVSKWYYLLDVDDEPEKEEDENLKSWRKGGDHQNCTCSFSKFVDCHFFRWAYARCVAPLLQFCGHLGSLFVLATMHPVFHLHEFSLALIAPT